MGSEPVYTGAAVGEFVDDLIFRFIHQFFQLYSKRVARVFLIVTESYSKHKKFPSCYESLRVCCKYSVGQS